MPEGHTALANPVGSSLRLATPFRRPVECDVKADTGLTRTWLFSLLADIVAHFVAENIGSRSRRRTFIVPTVSIPWIRVSCRLSQQHTGTHLVLLVMLRSYSGRSRVWGSREQL